MFTSWDSCGISRHISCRRSDTGEPAPEAEYQPNSPATSDPDDVVVVGAGEPEVIETEYIAHPSFPKLPASVPLTYTLTMVACLSAKPEDRPSFAQVLTVLSDVEAEVARGQYINSVGVTQVFISLKCAQFEKKGAKQSYEIPHETFVAIFFCLMGLSTSAFT
jgi:hypothetical protein